MRIHPKGNLTDREVHSSARGKGPGALSTRKALGKDSGMRVRARRLQRFCSGPANPKTLGILRSCLARPLLQSSVAIALSGAIRSAMASQVGAALNAQTWKLGAFQGLWATSGHVQLNPSQVSFAVVPSSTSSRRCVVVRAATAVAPKFTTMKPLGDRILVKIQTVEEKSAGGILLPTTAQNKPQGGEVVAVSQGKTVGDKTLEPAVKPGAQVVYSKYAGTEVDFNGERHLLLKEDDIVGLLSTDDFKDLQPANDRVLVLITEMESKTAGGVLLTDSAKEKPVIGTVVATGPGAYGEDGDRKPLEVTKGNTVLYSKYAGNDFKSKDGTQFVVLRVSDVLAVLA